jgi:predicted Rossmann-fold nucleotide-binding protein
VRAADAVVAIGGGWGTLSEIALALRRGIPVLGVDTWELARAGEPVAGIRTVDDAQTAVAEALRLARRA